MIMIIVIIVSHRSIVAKRLHKIVTKLRVAQRSRGPWMMFILSTRSTRTCDVQWIRISNDPISQ